MRAAGSVIMGTDQILVTPAGEGMDFEEANVHMRTKQANSVHWSLLLTQRWEVHVAQLLELLFC